ncbi:hypothetical protein [Haladaptatus sp. T7]|uniref:hypothetical protein n=1 Tax=Haladaptatus sp. T7 TaxID=2029368 RepID=UPI0021A25A47|nr:hypothetical protein [Haladaptatus sp. T7]GKZ15851.1 hypothetical protein HAL_37320 [Haladaptatus sp. T7]
MSPTTESAEGLPLRRILLIALLLLATPLVAFVLIAGALTADAGLGGWLLLVVAPLSFLGTGLWLLAGGSLRWPKRVDTSA